MRYEKRILGVLTAAIGSMSLYSITAEPCAAQSPIEYAIPTSGSGPWGIATGPDGDLWFVESGTDKIGKITTSGVFTEYVIPTAHANSIGIVAGPDGNLWFTEFNSNKVGKVTTGGTVTEYATSSGGTPGWIAKGPDGNLWFTEYNGNKIAKITTGGTISEFVVPTSSSLPNGIVAGPDGNLWFTEAGGNKVGKITTAGAFAEYPLPTSGATPDVITAGPDGNLWFTEFNGNKIGKVTTAGVVTEYTIPTAASNPLSIAAGADGNLWFTEFNASKIGKITPAGVITEYPTTTSNANVVGIAAGPDGNLWFAESNANSVAMIDTYGQVFSHLAMGPLGSDVWTTSIILNNTTNNPAPFTIEFFQDNGQPLPLASGISNETHLTGLTEGPNGQSSSGVIPVGGSLTEVLSSGNFAEGWATLRAPDGVTGQAVFHRHTSAGADYEATVPLSAGGTEYRVPFDETSYFNGTAQVTTLPYITGMALANLDPTLTATINCAILDPNGASLGTAAPVSIQPMGHTALQLIATSGFGNVPGNIGSLDCTSNGPLFSVLGLRFLGVNDFTSFAAIKLR